MTRPFAFSIATLLLPMAAVATGSHPPATTRYSLIRVEAVAVPAAAGRYHLSSDMGAVTAARRFQLLGADAAKASTEACASGDELFAHGFEN